MTPMKPPPVLEVQDVSRTFKLSRSLFEKRLLRAVDGVSLTLRKGEVLGIVGESGSGKTTLSKMMLGLLRPSSGLVLLDGQPLDHYPRRTIARRVQFVFQDPYSSLNPRHTIGSIVAQPLRIHGIGDRAERQKRARELLDVVGLPSRVLGSYPGQLSGGQRQRVVIARALALRPEILICDEPTSALDVSVQAQILNLLLDLRREFDLSYVLVSHNLSVVEHMATQVAVMYLGRIVELDEAERLFRDPRHPYTKVLLQSAMTIAPRAGIPNVRLGGAIPNPAALPSGCRFHPRCPEAVAVCSRVPPPTNSDGLSLAECHLVAPRDGAAPGGQPASPTAPAAAPSSS
jgi:peptide/nickel transport system ATP-binding protein